MRTPLAGFIQLKVHNGGVRWVHTDSAEECLKSEVQLNEAGRVLSEASGQGQARSERERLHTGHLGLARASSAVLSTFDRTPEMSTPSLHGDIVVPMELEYMIMKTTDKFPTKKGNTTETKGNNMSLRRV